MTNMEKIKNMTIEELATMLSQDALWKSWLHPEYCGIVAEGDNPGFCDDDCYECVLEWLKQEATNLDFMPSTINLNIEKIKNSNINCFEKENK